MPLSYAFKVVKKFYVTHFTAIKTVKKVYLPVVQLDQFSSALDPMPGFRFRHVSPAISGTFCFPFCSIRIYIRIKMESCLVALMLLQQDFIGIFSSECTGLLRVSRNSSTGAPPGPCFLIRGCGLESSGRRP